MLGPERVGRVALHPGEKRIPGALVGAADVVVVNGLRDGLDTGGLGHRLDEVGGTGQLVRSGDRVAELRPDPAGHRLHVGEQAFGCGLLRVEGVGEDRPQLRDALTGHG